MVHEWALAEAILDTVSDLARKNGFKRIKKLTLSIGSLQNIEIEILEDSLDILKKDYSIKIERIVFESEDAMFRCKKCNYEWTMEDTDLDEDVREAIHFLPESLYAFVNCPRCGSIDFDVIKGRGIYIKRIEAIR